MAGSVGSPSSSSSSTSSSLLLLFNLTTALLLLLLLALPVAASASAAVDVSPLRLRAGAVGPGRKVGGWTEVRGVEADREVQDLGLFCVEEHNRRLRRRDDGGGGGGRLLTFGRVVAAQRQVVSGIKYYLRIAASADGDGDGGERRRFDAVVVVKPWLPSRTLISFRPAVDGY